MFALQAFSLLSMYLMAFLIKSHFFSKYLTKSIFKLEDAMKTFQLRMKQLTFGNIILTITKILIM